MSLTSENLSNAKRFNIELKQLLCKRCLHEWLPRKTEVRTCPKCRSPYWDRKKERPYVRKTKTEEANK
ncbi:MAG: hypothetical protein DDT23_00879 [candidate division WS2 bacterium]|nr:hypothetical protein [Candidatus Lithacetigena glycinireducens]